MKTALITGITGQDGSYLAELLLEKGYQVHGLVRRSSNTVRMRLDHLTRSTLYEDRLFLHYADLDDTTTIRRLILNAGPDELYHLAGQSHVGASFEIPESTCEMTAMGTLRLLEILRDCDPVPKLLHTSSSEVFGRPDDSPQDENTPFKPVTPYGVAKAFATNMVRVYRESFDFFACNAICFNHESPRRGESFVTRKIVRAAVNIAAGNQKTLKLGSLDGKRDWGFAPEYVRAFWMMLQNDTADDYVLATGSTHTVRDWLDEAFKAVGLDWHDFVEQDPRFLRKADPAKLVGNSEHAQAQLGWRVETSFSEMVQAMVESEKKAIL